jgi:hypothetical protein
VPRPCGQADGSPCEIAPRYNPRLQPKPWLHVHRRRAANVELMHLAGELSGTTLPGTGPPGDRVAYVVAKLEERRRSDDAAADIVGPDGRTSSFRHCGMGEMLPCSYQFSRNAARGGGDRKHEGSNEVAVARCIPACLGASGFGLGVGHRLVPRTKTVSGGYPGASHRPSRRALGSRGAHAVLTPSILCARRSPPIVLGPLANAAKQQGGVACGGALNIAACGREPDPPRCTQLCAGPTRARERWAMVSKSRPHLDWLDEVPVEARTLAAKSADPSAPVMPFWKQQRFYFSPEPRGTARSVGRLGTHLARRFSADPQVVWEVVWRFLPIG